MKIILSVFLLFIICIAGTFAAMVAFGLIDMDKMMGKEQKKEVKQVVQAVNPNLVPVLLSTQHLSAYERVERDNLLDPKTARYRIIPLDPENLPADTLTSYGEIAGRVLRRDKSPNLIFRESDFYPPGTREGIAAAIEPGYRAVVLNADGLAGVHDLNPGDRLDIVAIIPVKKAGQGPMTASEFTRSTEKEKDPSPLGVETLDIGFKNPEAKVYMRPVVNNAMVVKPVSVRNVTYKTESTLTNAGKMANKPIREITVSVKAEEIPALYEAMETNATLHCAVRSGHAITDGDEGTIPSIEVDDKDEKVKIEEINGSNRTTRTLDASTLDIE
jgi:Flp pilus assembly protein CpaB